MILYIHGFAGSGKGKKATLLENVFKNEAYMRPTLSYIPYLAIDTLEQIINYIKDKEEICLIGSSLGGYYSIYLANKYNLKTVLINPSIEPTKTLSKEIGNTTNWADSSKFEWNKNHIDMLNRYKIEKPNPKNFLLLTQKGDEVLDYRVGVYYLKGSKQIVQEGGNHSFLNIIDYVEEIKVFFNINLSSRHFSNP